MEYFYETQKFFVGWRNENNQIFLSEASKDFSINDVSDLSSYIPSNYDNVTRINLIIPEGENHYCFYYHQNKDYNGHEFPYIQY